MFCFNQPLIFTIENNTTNNHPAAKIVNRIANFNFFHTVFLQSLHTRQRMKVICYFDFLQFFNTEIRAIFSFNKLSGFLTIRRIKCRHRAIIVVFVDYEIGFFHVCFIVLLLPPTYNQIYFHKMGIYDCHRNPIWNNKLSRICKQSAF